VIQSKSHPTKFKTVFTNGEHVSASDTTPDKGGANSGFRPHELLEAALANCMNMTLRMTAEKHGISLSAVSVAVSLNRSNPEAPVFEYRTEFDGDISEAQKERLLSALETCPVRNTLAKPLFFRHLID